MQSAGSCARGRVCRPVNLSIKEVDKQLQDSKTEHVAEIIRRISGFSAGKLLVVGCGSGIEAAILACNLNADVTGIDVRESFEPVAASMARLLYGDAMSMPFGDDSFDFVYSYHALEHIPDPEKALSEMSRVLRPKGGFWVGTPNRLRFLGYVGSKDATLSQKIQWNYIDWKARLKGRFRNEYGAHAGYSAGELESLLGTVFPVVMNVADDYYEAIYSNHKMLLGMLRMSGLAGIAYPSVYFMGSNG